MNRSAAGAFLALAAFAATGATARPATQARLVDERWDGTVSVSFSASGHTGSDQAEQHLTANITVRKDVGSGTTKLYAYQALLDRVRKQLATLLNR